MTRSTILLIIVLIVQISQNGGSSSPGSIINQVGQLKIVSVSQTLATINWQIGRSQKVTNYKISIKTTRFLGCRDLNIEPNFNYEPRVFEEEFIEESKFTFEGLNPYTEYEVHVTPCNEKLCATSKSIKIETLQTYLPTAAITNLNYTKQGTTLLLSWEQPINCKNMTGPIGASTIVFEGISPNVRGHRIEKTAEGFNFSVGPYIYGDEKYKIRVYPIRHPYADYNSSNYLEINFTSPAKAPPKPRKFAAWQIDTADKNRKIHLRWQAPEQPTNGKVFNYILKISNLDCDSYAKYAQTIELSNLTCSLWKDYTCYSYEMNDNNDYSIIKSFELTSYNKESKLTSRPICMDFDGNAQIKEVSTPPINLKLQPWNQTHQQLSWGHPLKTNTPIDKFNITFTLLSTRLIDTNTTTKNKYNILYPITTKSYNLLVNLLPGSEYKISITPVHKNGGKEGQTLTRVKKTSSLTRFNGAIQSKTKDNSSSSVVLSIPEILDETLDSVVYIIVSGPNPCPGYAKITPQLESQAKMNQSLYGWVAAKFPAKDYASKEFTVGDNQKYNGAINCPLTPKTSYSIIVMLGSEQDPRAETMNVVITLDKPITAASIISMEKPKEMKKKFNNLYWIIPVAVLGGALGMIVIVVLVRLGRRNPPEIQHKTLEEETDPKPHIYDIVSKNNLYTPGPQRNENAIYGNIGARKLGSGKDEAQYDVPPHVKQILAGESNLKGMGDEKPSPIQFTFRPQ